MWRQAVPQTCPQAAFLAATLVTFLTAAFLTAVFLAAVPSALPTAAPCAVASPASAEAAPEDDEEANRAKAATIPLTPESRWRSSPQARCTKTRWSGLTFTAGAFFWIQAISRSGRANLP